MQKASKAEAGKLGAEKSKLTSALNKQKRIDQYMENPNSCKQCGILLDYENRQKKFCSSSCSATYNNFCRENRTTPITWSCLNCNQEHATVEWRVGKYCSIKCQQEYLNKERIRKWLEEGKDWKGGSPQWAKTYLQKIRGKSCEICGITEWNGKSIVLEMDHIDGDHTHNRPENLRMICPNCHSQTDTYKNKNAGKGRQSRRKIL